MNAPESPLKHPSSQHERLSQRTRRRDGDDERPSNAKHEPDLHRLYTTHTICEPTDNNNEDASEEGRSGHGDIHHTHGDPEVTRHLRGDIERGLCK